MIFVWCPVPSVTSAFTLHRKGKSNAFFFLFSFFLSNFRDVSSSLDGPRVPQGRPVHSVHGRVVLWCNPLGALYVRGLPVPRSLEHRSLGASSYGRDCRHSFPMFSGNVRCLVIVSFCVCLDWGAFKLF